MVGVNWPERQNKRRIVVDIEKAGKATSSLIERPKATITAGIVMCSRCKCECELEIPAAGGKIDERLLQNIVEADQNSHRSEARNYSLFSPRQGPKGNYEKFREVSRKVVQEPFIPRRAERIRLEDRDEWRTRLVRPKSGASSAQLGEMRAQNEGNNRPSTTSNSTNVKPTEPGRVAMVQNGRWYLVGKGGKPERELTNTQARRVRRQYGKAKRYLENQTVNLDSIANIEDRGHELQSRERPTTGVLRPKASPSFPKIQEEKETKEPKLQHHTSGGQSLPYSMIPRLSTGKTILRRPSKAEGEVISCDQNNEKTMVAKPEGGPSRSGLKVIMPQKMIQAKLSVEEAEDDNLSEEEDDDWLNYELNHEEFKAALGLKIGAKEEGEQLNHTPALTFGTLEGVPKNTGTTERTADLSISKTISKKECQESQLMEVEPTLTTQKAMPVNMVYILPALYRSKEDQPGYMEGDSLIGDHPTALIHIIDDHDERPEILKMNESSTAGKIENSKGGIPRVFFTKPTRAMIKHLRPLFISAKINGVPFKKVLIDEGAAVNILPFKRLEKLGKNKADLIPTDLTVSNFVGTITATHGILVAEFEVGSKNLMVSYLVVDSTSSYHALMGRDWIHQSMSIPSSLQQELLMWDEELEDYEMIKADPQPFLPSANSVDARFYNEDIASLTIPELVKNGHSPVVMAQKIIQQGLVFSAEEWERPHILMQGHLIQMMLSCLIAH
ncbi:hypothetical protein CerSpe_209620 [Prunus speciosa]